MTGLEVFAVVAAFAGGVAVREVAPRLVRRGPPNVIAGHVLPAADDPRWTTRGSWFRLGDLAVDFDGCIILDTITVEKWGSSPGKRYYAAIRRGFVERETTKLLTEAP